MKKKPSAKTSAGKLPKFGSPAWFAKYPKAAKVKNSGKRKTGRK